MNVFEDLIEELKDENLLEETVIPLGRPSSNPVDPSQPAVLMTQGQDMLEHANDDVGAGNSSAETGAAEVEFYRKRAMEEVSSLQMVEHVLSGVEREHMKMVPATFDDLEVKKTLHRFLQLLGERNTDEHAHAETAFMHETQDWFSALAKRDSSISVANIRRFCENSRPVLSSQALMALARFYRNSPYSEPVRGKFDFVMTRLFSRETGEDQRKQLFDRGEMIGHIRTLYSNWASLELFTEDEYAEKIGKAVRGFDSFAEEAVRTASFDDLISTDLFNRIRVFKEETGELFFATEVTAAAIDCNVKVGNRFVELLRAEGDAGSLDGIEAKYGYTYDTVISTAASKTLHLLEILKEERAGRLDRRVEDESRPKQVIQTVDFERAPIDEANGFRLFKINKWLVAVAVAVIFMSGGIYLWSENVSRSEGEIAQATTVEVSDPDLRPYIRVARAGSDTLYGVAQPTWDAKSADEQKELLRKVFAMAQNLNMKRVNIMNNKGRTIGFASADRIEVFGP